MTPQAPDAYLLNENIRKAYPHITTVIGGSHARYYQDQVEMLPPNLSFDFIVPQDGWSAVDSPLVDPRAVAVDSKNHIYILERGGHSLRVVNRKGKIETVAGTGQRGFRDGPALQAQFNSPKHIAIDADDNVFIADDQNHAVRKFDASSGTVETVLGQRRGPPKIQLKQPK